MTGNLTRKEITSPIVFSAENKDKIQPIYPLTEGLTQKLMGVTVKSALKIFDEKIYEPIPKWILSRFKLSSLDFALNNIHFPTDFDSL